MLATVSYIAAAQHSRFRPSPSGHMKRLVHTASSCAIALALFFGSQSPDSTGPFTFGGDLAKAAPGGKGGGGGQRSEEHTSELQSLMRISYAVFCLKKKK